MTTQDHAAVIRAATAVLYRRLDAEGRPRAIGKHLEAIDNAAAALQRERDEAEARVDGMHEALLSETALVAAAKAVARIDRVNGPDPNSYVRFKPIDYARAAIEAALSVCDLSDPDGDDAP